MSQPPTLDDLQGDWKIVSFGQNGGKAPFFIRWLANFRFVVEGEQYSKVSGDKVFESGRLSVTPLTDYSQLDEHIEVGDSAGKTHLGIVRWVGRKLEHLQGKVDRDRPSGFPYTKKSMVGYAMMKRR